MTTKPFNIVKRDDSSCVSLNTNKMLHRKKKKNLEFQSTLSFSLLLWLHAPRSLRSDLCFRPKGNTNDFGKCCNSWYNPALHKIFTVISDAYSSELVMPETNTLTSATQPNATNKIILALDGSRDSVVGIATGYGLDDRRVGVRAPVGSRIFCSQCHLDRLWGPTSLLSYPKDTGVSFSGGNAAGGFESR
jgi:hypothetical protein